MTRKLGKLPAQPEKHKLKLCRYTQLDRLPTPPPSFGWDDRVMAEGGFPMGLNDRLGDCAIIGSVHIEQILLASAGKTFPYSDECVIENYSAITGYRPGPELENPDAPPNPTDQGTACVDLYRYWQQVGLIDANGDRHKIAAGLSLTPGDLNELAIAVWIFGAVGMGFQLPASAEEQFAAGQPWTVDPSSPTVGGHYVPIVGRGDGYWRGVTWAGEVLISDEFITAKCDEAWLGLSDEDMANGVNPDGFNWETLESDVEALADAKGAVWHPQEPGQFPPDPYPEPV